jgi:hypothetical protein
VHQALQINLEQFGTRFKACRRIVQIIVDMFEKKMPGKM